MNIEVGQIFQASDMAAAIHAASKPVAPPPPKIVYRDVVKKVPGKNVALNRFLLGAAIVAGVGLVVTAIVAYNTNVKAKKADKAKSAAEAKANELAAALKKEKAKYADAFFEQRKRDRAVRTRSCTRC